MRGQYVPSPYDTAAASDDPLEEIRKAIDEVRFSSGPARSSSSRTDGFPVQPETPWVVPRLVFVNPIDRLDGHVIVPIRGQVPLAFFRWFDELKSKLEGQRTMLNACRFEAAD